MKGRIAVMTAPGELEFQEYELPTPKSGELLLEVIRANLDFS